VSETQPQTDSPTLVWAKSSFSNNGGSCLEVSRTLLDTKGLLLVRDSKNPDGGQLSFTPAEWTAFVKGAAAGEFNL
jgi:hypothetical protein